MAKRAIFDKKNVLVCGGAGFIGSHLCDELIKSAKVICIDNYISGRVENIEHLLGNSNFMFIKYDVSEPMDLEKFPELEKFQIKFQGIQEIYNLACPTSRKDFEKNIIATLRANSSAVYYTLELARKYQAKYLLASTSSIYGDTLEGQETIAEDYWGFLDQLSPRGCYNEGKRFAETMAINYSRQYNLEVKIARIFNTYGPRMQFNSGRMIPDFVQAAVKNQNLIIYGNGGEEDSYCYIKDMVDGLVKLMNYPMPVAMNIGSPEKHSIIKVAEEVIKLTNSSSQISFSNRLPYLTKPGIASIEKAKKELGWFPLINLTNGLKKTVDDMLGSRVLTYASVMNNLK